MSRAKKTNSAKRHSAINLYRHIDDLLNKAHGSNRAKKKKEKKTKPTKPNRGER